MRSLRQTLEGMCLHFDPSAAEGLEATLQFEVSGDEPGTYHLDINRGVCTFHEGPVDDATLTIRTPSDVWQRIGSGELSGRDALMQDLYEVEGDAGLLMRMDSLFQRGKDLEVEAPSDQRPAGPIPLAGMHWLGVGFLPWIVLWVFFGSDGGGGWPALAISLALSAAIVTYRRTYNRPTAFEVASLVFFAAALAAWPWLSAWLAPWGSTVGTLFLGATWLATVLPAREPKPLTANYSKWQYKPALWSNSTFLHVNGVLTLMWGWVFVVQGSFDVWTAARPSLSGALAAGWFLLLVPAAVITVRYPKRGSEIELTDPSRSAHRLRYLALFGLTTAFGLTVATVLAGMVAIAGIGS